jgi:hypothetical protein
VRVDLLSDNQDLRHQWASLSDVLASGQEFD